MDALRELGYDSYASILDLIDNSIDADATHVWVSISESKGDIQITAEDDGSGMDEETLKEALRLGSDTARDAGDLGKFGMGLVTASIGLSRKVEVLTRDDSGEALYGGFDLDQIAELDRFVKEVRPAGVDAQLLRGTTGTRLALAKTDRISNRHTTTFANTLRRKAGQTFRKFLKAGLTIEINGSAVEPIDPLMLTHPGTRLVLEMDMPVADGQIGLRVVDLPDLGKSGNESLGIVADNSGFYIVRNNREIQAAQTFDFYKKHPDFAHFRAELTFDGTLDGAFHTDVKKMSTHLEQSILDRLRSATQGLITESGRQGRSRANTSRGQIDHSVAEANIVRRASLIPKPPALVEERKRRGKAGSHSAGSGDRARTPHITTLRTAAGLRVAFEEGDYGEQGPFYLVRQNGNVITVTYNREHPFWRELVDRADDPRVVAILDYLVFALANSELLVPEQATIVKANVNTTLVGLLV
jgi:hypothetical protein